MILRSLDRYRDLGLLLLRIGIGSAFMFAHGWGKITGGPERWRGLGGSAAHVGLDFAPEFWGFMSAVAEFGGGLLLVLGLFFRPALLLLVINMIVATTMHIVTGMGSPWAAVEAGILFASLLLIGPGRYSLDEWLASRRAATSSSRR